MNKSEKFWDKISKNYEKQAQKDKTYKKILEITRRHLKSSDIVMDYGCATGLYSIETAVNVKKIHGIDISSKMIENAKRKAGELNIENIDFAQATIFDERYRREYYDVILAFNIIHLVEDNQKVIQRINELLKRGGLIISSTPCLGEKKSILSILSGIAILFLIKIGVFPFIKFFKVRELEDSITNENFQIIETETLTYNSASEYFIAAKKI